MVFLNWLKKLKLKIGSKPDWNDFNWYKKQFKNIFDIDINSLTRVGKLGLVSIVLPVYNGEKYLRFAIESVLNQTYKNWELIIVNDGSFDSSGEIAEEYAKSIDSVKYINLDKNMKLPYALNIGFDYAEGALYTWMSHDNILLPEFLDKFVSEMNSNPNAAMVYGNLILIDESGETKRGYGWYEFPPLSGNVMLPASAEKLNVHANNTIGAAFMYRASVASIIGEYAVDRFGIEDYDYWMRINEIFDIVHTSFSEPLYKYRIHNQSLSSRDNELKITENRPNLMHRDYLRRKYLLCSAEYVKFNIGRINKKFGFEVLKQKIDKLNSLNNDELEESLININ